MSTLQACGIVSVSLAIVSTARAQTPLGTGFTYQGQLKSAGAPLTGTADLQFSLWDAAGSGSPPSGGMQIGSTQTVSGVSVSAGLFTVQLNAAGEFGGSAFNGDARWLQIAVCFPAGSGSYTTLAPRQPVTSAPYASYALEAERLTLPFSGSAADTGAVLAITNTSSTGLAAIRGENGGTSGRAIVGVASAGTGMTYGGYFESMSEVGTGVYGLASGTTSVNYGGLFDSHGVNGTALVGRSFGTTSRAVVGHSYAAGGTGVDGACLDLSTTPATGVRGTVSYGTGVYGQSAATSGSNFGGHFHSQSPDGTGAYGLHNNTSGTNPGLFGNTISTSSYAAGVLGQVSSTAPGSYSAGVRGINNGIGGTGIGVWGSQAGSGWGVYGTSVSGRGVSGAATGATGVNYGVYGETNSASGFAGYFVGRSYFSDKMAVGPSSFGENAMVEINSTMGGRGLYCRAGYWGIYAIADASDPYGTIGVVGTATSTQGTGVYGHATRGSGVNYGVYGLNYSPDGYGVYSVGRFAATGTKSLRIDHPLAPGDKYLQHYCFEGPEPQNIYNGVVVLDADGAAEITLPEYFAAINRDPRYTLTAIGAPMPDLHVGEEIESRAISAGEVCRFRIAGGKPGAKVSWEVKGVRNDLFVRAYGAPVESQKAGSERGRYMHPELYGQPPEKGMDYRPELQDHEPKHPD